MQDDIQMLIKTFKEYRDLITPIEASLKSFSVSFDSIREDIKNLNLGTDGSVQTKLDKIYRELSSQADKTKSLTSEVDRFLATTNKYVSSVDNLVNTIAKVEKGFATIDSIEGKAIEQIEKLNVIIEDKRKNYDVKSLEKKIDQYSSGVEKVNDYINKDVIEVLSTSHEKINQIQDKNKSIYESIINEKESIDKLVDSYTQSNQLLRKIVEQNDVNEQYIYEILDKWADDRKVKTKK